MTQRHSDRSPQTRDDLKEEDNIGNKVATYRRTATRHQLHSSEAALACFTEHRQTILDAGVMDSLCSMLQAKQCLTSWQEKSA